MQQIIPGYRLTKNRKYIPTGPPRPAEQALIDEAQRIGLAINREAYAIVEAHLRDTLIGGEAAIKDQLSRGLTYEQMALCLIRDAVAGWLETGWYHTSKGRLDTKGPASNLRALFTCALQGLVGAGFITEEEAASEEDRLHTAILGTAPCHAPERGAVPYATPKDALCEALEVISLAGKKFVRDGVFEDEAFRLSTEPILQALGDDAQGLWDHLRRSPGCSASDWVYSAISNIAGNLLESGRYHIYRGVLNTLSAGPALLLIFDGCTDELVRSGNIDANYAREQKKQLRANIKEVG